MCSLVENPFDFFAIDKRDVHVPDFTTLRKKSHSWSANHGANKANEKFQQTYQQYKRISHHHHPSSD